MQRAKRSALPAILLLCGCDPGQEPDRVLRVEAHLAEADAPPTGELGLELTALGDFEGSAFTSEFAPGDARALRLAFPGKTRAVSATAESFVGIGEADGSGDIDVLLYRAKEATTLWPVAGADFPVEPLGASLGVDSAGRRVLVTASTDAGRAFSVDLTTGRAREVEEGMLPARAFASVSAFGEDSMLVAGGVDPTLEPPPPLDTASIFHWKSARFDRTRVIPLAQPRTRHSAVVLASGETLLVGGAGPGGGALATLEAISPEDQASRIAGLIALKRARIAPHVLRLSDDRIFVGGGSDGSAPVGVLEWLTPDAHALALVVENVVLASAHSFAAMPDGGVLGVGACVQSCFDAGVVSRSVTWFRKDGSADDLTPLPFTPTALALIRAEDGAPWLWGRAGTVTHFEQLDPWSGSFSQPIERPEVGPDPDLPPPLAVDAGAFVWLERASVTRLSGFRHSLRGRYGRDVAPLLLASPEHVAPSRLPLGLSKSGIEYSTGGLALRDARADVSNTDYADLDLSLTLGPGRPPLVALGSQRFGGADCPWPSLDPVAAGELVELHRRGTSLLLERGGKNRECSIAAGRVAVALEGDGSSESRVRSLEIRRR